MSASLGLGRQDPLLSWWWPNYYRILFALEFFSGPFSGELFDFISVAKIVSMPVVGRARAGQNIVYFISV